MNLMLRCSNLLWQCTTQVDSVTSCGMCYWWYLHCGTLKHRNGSMAITTTGESQTYTYIMR